MSDRSLADTFTAADLALLAQDYPQFADELAEAITVESREHARRRYESSLVEFFKRAWQEIDPAPLEFNWHHEIICHHLELITGGELRNLIINVPPRHSKSVLVNVMWPAWTWCRASTAPLSGAHVKFLCVSYGATLSEEIAVKMLRLVRGHWYRSLWGDRVRISPDQTSRANFGNDAGGERISNSIEGGLLGRGGDIQICFPYDEIVWSERGPRQIGELVEHREDCRVWSFNRAKRQFELRRVVGWHCNPSRPLVRIVTERGSLTCTADHRVLGAHGYVKAGNLTAGSTILCAQSRAAQGNSGIPVDDRASHQFGRDAESAFACADTGLTSDTTEIGDFVIEEIGDRQPTLYRVLRVECVQDVHRHTYCVTVEHNGNMLIGQPCVCASNCDDPHNVRTAESEIERHNTLQAFSEGLTTRVTDPRIAARVLIMQRLHEDDCTNWALEHWPAESTVHLMFPGEFVSDRACPHDPRTVDGELLWPAMWGREAIEKLRLELGPYAFEGQIQQAPAPREGGIIGRNDWMVYPETTPQPGEVQRQADGQLLVRLPELSYVVAAIDTAASEKETADWNALAVFGIWHRRRNDVAGAAPWFAERWSGVRDPEKETQRIIDEDDQPRAILVEAWRRRCRLNDEQLDRSGKPSGLVQRVIETCRRRRVDLLIIENKTLGKAVYDEIRRQMRKEEFQILLFEPRQYGDKVARLHACVPLFTQKLVYAPGNLVERYNQIGNSYVSIEEFIWVQTVMDEISQVPRGRHDDLADAVAMCLLILRKNGFLAMTQEYISESLRSRMWQRRQRPVGEQYGVL